MKELFKTLEFIEPTPMGKYAHPVDDHEWGCSDIPLIMTLKTTIRTLKEMYPNLDFDQVRLVIKEIRDIPTNNG